MVYRLEKMYKNMLLKEHGTLQTKGGVLSRKGFKDANGV